MVEEGCDKECVDNTPTADVKTYEAVAALCGCPSFMLRYNMAQTSILAEEQPNPEPEAKTSKTPYIIGGWAAVIGLLCRIGVFCCEE